MRITVCFEPEGQGIAIITEKKVEKLRIPAPKHRFFKIQLATERMKVFDFFQKYDPIKAHFSKKNCLFIRKNDFLGGENDPRIMVMVYRAAPQVTFEMTAADGCSHPYNPVLAF